MTFFTQVKQEMEEMKKAGLRVPTVAFKLLESENESEYKNMSVSSAADLIIQLSDL